MARSGSYGQEDGSCNAIREDGSWSTVREAQCDEIARVVQFLAACGVPEEALLVVESDVDGDGAREPGGHGFVSRFIRRAPGSRRQRLVARNEYLPTVTDLLRPFAR